MLAADLIAATRRHLTGTHRPELNQLSGAVTRDQTTWTFANTLGGIVAGSVVSCELEDVYVWSVTGSTATVLRGYNGSVQAAHADTEIVTVNSRYTDWELLCRLNDDLADLSAPLNGLYAVRTLDLTAVAGRVGYDFPAVGLLSVADARWREPATIEKRWYDLDVEVLRDLPTSDFPSGIALMVTGKQPTAGQTIRVRYRATFSPLANLTDDVAAVTGLPDTALDVPPLGAAVGVMAGRPVGRAQYQTQGDTRRAAEVSTGDVLNAPAALRAMRTSRVAAEAARLAQRWPQTLNRVRM